MRYGNHHYLFIAHTFHFNRMRINREISMAMPMAQPIFELHMKKKVSTHSEYSVRLNGEKEPSKHNWKIEKYRQNEMFFIEKYCIDFAIGKNMQHTRHKHTEKMRWLWRKENISCSVQMGTFVFLHFGQWQFNRFKRLENDLPFDCVLLQCGLSFRHAFKSHI